MAPPAHGAHFAVNGAFALRLRSAGMHVRSLQAQESLARPEISLLPAPGQPSRELTRSYVGWSDMRCPLGAQVTHPGTGPGLAATSR